MPYHFRQPARNVSRPRLSPSSPSGSPGMHPFLGADGGPPLLVTCSGDAVSWSHPFAPCLSSSPPFFAIRCIRLRLFCCCIVSSLGVVHASVVSRAVFAGFVLFPFAPVFALFVLLGVVCASLSPRRGSVVCWAFLWCYM